MIIISDFDEEMEAREETLTEAEVMPSVAAGKSSTLATSPADADENPGAALNDISDGLAPGLKMGKDNDSRDEVGAP
jgi:hypothetical protein